MRVEATSAGEVAIVLTVAESRDLMVDHGECEICIPVADTLGFLEELSDARREIADGLA